MRMPDRMTVWLAVAFICLPHALCQGVTRMETTFDKIEGQEMLTKDGRRLAISGKMSLPQSGVLHEAIFKGGGSIAFPEDRNPCWANLDQCQTGFTLTISTKLTILYDNDLVIASSGVDKYDSKGLLLSYNRRNWGFKAIVRTSTLQWVTDVPYHWMPQKWLEIVFSWSPREGIAVVIDGFTTATQGTSSTIKQVTKTHPLCLGCSYRGVKFTSSFSVRKVTQADTYYKDLIKAGHLAPDKALPEKSETVVDFLDIVGKQVIGTIVKMDSFGKVTLEDDDAGKVLVMENAGSYVNIGKIGHPCLDDIDTCSAGFTIRIVFTLMSDTTDRQVILSSGAETQNVRGMSIHYEDKVISVYVKSSTKSWTSRFQSTLNTGVWYTLDVTWSSKWGIELHLNNKQVQGTTAETSQATKAISMQFLLGKAPNDAKTTSMRVFEIVLWNSLHERLDKADMQVPRLKDIDVTTTRSTTTPTPKTTPKQATTTQVRCPDLKSSPTLKAVTDRNGNMKFSCALPEVPPTNVEVLMVFQVQGENFEKWKVITSPDKEASLTMDEMGMPIYNKKVYCSVRVRVFEKGAQWCSEKKVSNSFQMTIKLQTVPQQILILEGQPSYELVITSTAPPSAFCSKEDQGNCRVEVVTTLSTASNEMKCPYKEVIPQAVLGVSVVGQVTKSCGVTLTSKNWSKDLIIPIKATIDGVLDGNQERSLRVKVLISSLVTNKVSTIDLATIKVKIIENDRNKICSSFNDPHLKTFDTKSYNMHIPGEYVLYKHRQLEYEVRSLYEFCSVGGTTGPTCNRGVAVRSGDDVISFTTEKKTGLSVQMYLNQPLTPGTLIYRHGSGNKYDVVLPHGTLVTVKYSSGLWINIDIKPSSTDLRQTEGLCGTYNDRTDDDFDFLGGIRAFAMKWKRTNTIFRGVQAKKMDKAPTYCSCQENQVPRCEPNLDNYHCLTVPSSVTDLTKYLIQQAQTPHFRTVQKVFRRKRGATDDNMFKNTLGAADSSRWTLTSARDHCEKFLDNATQVKMCGKQIDSNDTQLAIESCALDILALGETKWTQSHLDRLIEVCLTTVTRDVKQWTDNGEGIVGPPTRIVDSLCPFDCGNHGQCIYGVCRCNSGWTGERCEIGINSKPEVFPAEEACDVLSSTSSCHVVGIEGDKFVSSANLTCVFQFVQVTGSKVLNVGQPEMVDARYLSQYKVSCEQTKNGGRARSAFVAISNNGGKTRSDARYLHVVHKATCEQCHLQDDGRGVSCTKVAESCEIDGECYAKFERFEGDACYRCDPAKHKDKWTRTSEPSCPNKDDARDDNLAMIFIILFVVLAVALICMIVVVIILKRRRTQSAAIKFDKTDTLTLQPE